MPHQLERLQQLAIQTHLKNAGTVNAISDDRLANLLNISKQQRAELKKKGVEVKRKLDEDIAKLKEKAELESLSVLTSEQQSELKRLIGKKYERQEVDFNESLRKSLDSSTQTDRR